MIRSIIALMLLASVTFGQHRSLPPDSAPTPSTPGNVTLSLAEYNRLVELAAHKKADPDIAPLPFVLGRAAFKVRLENDSLIGDLDIGGAVLQKGAARVSLITGLTVLDAQQSGGALPLLQDGAAHVAILNPGPFSVSLTVATPLTVEAGRASFTLPVPAASNSLLTLDLPAAHANLKVQPAFIPNPTNTNPHTL